MAGATIGIALANGIFGVGVSDVMGTFGVVILCTFLVVVLTSGLIAHDANRLYSMMAWVFATFQATVAGMTEYLHLFWAEDDDILVDQPLVIPDELPINPHLRDVVLYQTMFRPLETKSYEVGILQISGILL